MTSPGTPAPAPPPPPTAGDTPAGTPGIKVDQIFLEAAELSHRSDALALPAGTQANVGEVTLEISIGMAPDTNAGFIRIAVATQPSLNPLYSFRVAMIALVSAIEGVAGNMSVRTYLERAGVLLLFPFVREAVASLTIRGRFGPIWLQPINPQSIAEELSRKAFEKVVPPFGSSLTIQPAAGGTGVFERESSPSPVGAPESPPRHPPTRKKRVAPTARKK